jgi:GT2 family glycosyltransferase
VIVLDSSPRPQVSLVAVAYGRRELLARMLTSVQDQGVGSLSVEVIVVDNDSPDDTVTFLAEQVQGVRVIPLAENLGFGQGTSVGVRAASGEVVVLMNTDVEVRAGWLAPLVEAAQRYGASAPVSVDSDGRTVEFGAWISDDGHVHLLGPGGGAEELEGIPRFSSPGVSSLAAHASAACLAMKRSVYQSLGGFDPVFGLGYHEDVDLFAAMEASGLGALRMVPESTVIHSGGGSFHAEQAARLAARNHRRTQRRWAWLRRGVAPNFDPADHRWSGGHRTHGRVRIVDDGAAGLSDDLLGWLRRMHVEVIDDRDQPVDLEIRAGACIGDSSFDPAGVPGVVAEGLDEAGLLDALASAGVAASTSPRLVGHGAMAMRTASRW